MRINFALTALLLAVSALTSSSVLSTSNKSISLPETANEYSFFSGKDPVPTVSDIPNLLAEKYPGSYAWEYVASESNSLSDMYGTMPSGLKEDMKSIQQAKSAAGITRKYIGCGPLAIISQFDILSTAAGYSLFNPQESRLWGDEILKEPSLTTSQHIMESSPVIDFGDYGAGMKPNMIANVCNALMKEVGASFVEKGPAGVFEDEDLLNSIMYPSKAGPWNMSQAEKESLVRNEIDLGVPVIWDTVCINDSELGRYASHAMNLVGYRTYKGRSVYGDTLKYTYYDVRMNWGDTTCIVDPVYFTGGIENTMIPFFRIRDSIRIRPGDYGLSSSYNNSPLTKTITDATGRSVIVKRLRTGLVKHYDSSNTQESDQQFLVLSCNRKSGTSFYRDAYVEYTLPMMTDWVRFDMSLWGAKENLLYTGGDYVDLEIKNTSGEWETIEKLLPQLALSGTYLREYTHFDIHLPYKTSEVRIVAHDASGNSTSNRGRVVLGNFNAVFPALD